mmetsp:Transcript_504/g.668  ORF Transcript_504/g.668 Transcript_504/m.668 type:complete len:122 (+) Transcript_504:3-368(+)|eukprot:CAMPEP_0172612168 /NCGR_PEP_ID=MMETSP1068-20121228/31751_1 /TAXON_ID=35684 /ORGANISM="Pseudopedinella elastica, Strain CCMP716" /LENGTH=121 /DNA_ID=CAMNT_0013416315 /DNA_START=127 /DNA_END=492 /DNA_ORIENTATION=-
MTGEKMPDFEPPQAAVHRIVKAHLPENCQVTKESKSAFAKAAGIFIMYLTSCSNDFCQENKRSTVSSADVLAALAELEFGDMIPDIEEFLAGIRSEANERKKESKAASSELQPEAGNPNAE